MYTRSLHAHLLGVMATDRVRTWHLNKICDANCGMDNNQHSIIPSNAVMITSSGSIASGSIANANNSALVFKNVFLLSP
jgi:hypothetical protein